MARPLFDHFDDAPLIGVLFSPIEQIDSEILDSGTVVAMRHDFDLLFLLPSPLEAKTTFLYIFDFI